MLCCVTWGLVTWGHLVQDRPCHVVGLVDAVRKRGSLGDRRSVLLGTLCK